MRTIFLLLLCHVAHAQLPTDLSVEGLRGRVRMVTDIEYVDEQMKKPFMKTVDKYDSRGYLTESIHNDYVLKQNGHKLIKNDTAERGRITKRREYEDTALIRTLTYTYDSVDRLLTEEDRRFYDGREMVYRTEYIYDSAGRKTADKHFTNGFADRSTLYAYDEQGRVVTETSLDTAGKQLSLAEYFYRGTRDWVICQRKAGEDQSHLFRTIDTAGLLIERTKYNADYSKKTNETNLSFDKYGNWLTQSVTGTITEHFYIARKIEYYE